MARQGRKQRFEFTVATIQKRWGVEAIRKASDIPAPALPVCSTGFRELDRVLANGGLPRGRFCELIGYGTSGQFTVAAKALAHAQRHGEQVAYIDIQSSVDVDSLVRCGVRLDALIILRPRSFLHALAMTHDLLRAGGVGAILFDRIHDLHQLADGEAFAGLDRALRDWTPILNRSLGLFLFITETTSPGLYPEGLPLPFFASLRLEFERQGWLTRGQQIVGYISRVKVIKNRLGPEGANVLLKIRIT